jgi:hypothetical protein
MVRGICYRDLGCHGCILGCHFWAGSTRNNGAIMRCVHTLIPSNIHIRSSTWIARFQGGWVRCKTRVQNFHFSCLKVVNKVQQIYIYKVQLKSTQNTALVDPAHRRSHDNGNAYSVRSTSGISLRTDGKYATPTSGISLHAARLAHARLSVDKTKTLLALILLLQARVRRCRHLMDVHWHGR